MRRQVGVGASFVDGERCSRLFVLTIIKKSNVSAAIQRGSLSRQNVHLAASVGSA